MAGYTRQSSLNNGDTITALLFNNEYNQLLAAFNNTAGHKHDGTAAEGPVIGLIGDAGLTTPLNKILIDSTNDLIEFSIDVSGTSTEQFRLQDGAIIPTTDNDIDLGTSSLEFKDAFFDGTVTLDGLVIGSATSITDVDIDLNAVSASDDTVASAKAIKTYVDAQVTASDLDFSGNAGGSQSVDLDSQSLTLTGGTGIDTTGSAQTMTFAIDNTVATLTDTQTLSAKTLTSPVLDTSISGTAFLDEDNMASNSATKLASQQSIKAYVDATVTNENLDFQADSGGPLEIDLDSETLTLAGGTGIDTVGAGNGVTFSINNTVATLTDSQTLSAKTLTSAVLNNTISGTSIKDEDNMSSNSASHLATQQSIKAYVDTQVATVPVGDITSVIAGDALTGGGISGAVTLDVATDNSSIEINSDALRVKASGITNAMLAGSIDSIKIANGNVSNTEFQYLDGVTSAIQTQLNTKASAGFAVAMSIAL
jgi:hypothetical protein